MSRSAYTGKAISEQKTASPFRPAARYRSFILSFLRVGAEEGT